MGLKAGVFCGLFLNGIITLPIGLVALYVGKITIQEFLFMLMVMGFITFCLGGFLIDD